MIRSSPRAVTPPEPTSAVAPRRMMRVPPRARTALLDALAVVSPVACAGCGAPDRTLCASCLLALRLPPVIRTLALPAIRRADGTLPARSVPVGCGSAYASPWPDLLSALKEEGRTDAARALSVPLARAIHAALASASSRAPESERGVEVIGVPSSGAAIRRRGYAPVDVLLARAGIRCVRLPGPLRRHPLRFTRRLADQAGLGVAARAANVHGGLAARADLSGRLFLVVDDVLTTGATLREACRAIRDAGGEVVACAVLTTVPARGGRDGAPRPP